LQRIRISILLLVCMDALGPIPLAAPHVSATPSAEGPCPVCGRLAKDFEDYYEAQYYRAQHQRAVEREARLKTEVQQLKAKVRLLQQQLFGRSSEAASVVEAVAGPIRDRPRRPRGQQPGRRSPAKRSYTHLPATAEIHDLPPEQRHCACCGKPFVPFPGSDDSEILEVAVRAHRRIIRRPRYRPTCSCPQNKPIVTAPPAPRVVPKSKIGVSLWVEILLDKYLLQRPTYRLLEAWRLHGLDLSLGTVTDGLQRLEPLFAPLYEALIERSRQQPLWHADETRWQVFVTWEGKAGHGWYLWVFHAADVAVFVLSPTRAHDVPEEHLGAEAEGILVVDRYSAYKVIQQVQSGAIRLAFCWAHVRRDFLGVAQSYSEHRDWGLAWVERIGVLYQLNDARLEQLPDSPAWTAADQRLRDQVAAMTRQREAELAATPPLAQAKVLISLQTHWDGLTLFVDHPEVPLDNNSAERAQRGPVVGRKNYYGSGAVWSGRLAAMLFSLFQTLCLWHVNPYQWLTAYLQACAEAGGQVPADATNYLPWNLSTTQRQAWSSHACPEAVNTS
jgi:transposase